MSACASASPRLLLGIGDQNPSVFSDPAFASLGVKRMRVITPYDTALTDHTAFSAWMAWAALDREQVVVAFNPSAGSHCPGQPCVLPSAKRYAAAFKAFHKLYPSIRIFQPWNEVNNLTQPTANNPQAVVTYYSIVKRLCRACTVLGADLEDLKKGPGVPARIDEGNYARALLADFKRAHVPTPKLWGLHNYVDVNYHRDIGTKTALKLLPGQIWLTETGGIAQFVLSSGKVRLPYSESRQASATKWLLRLASSNRRITRAYIYDMLNTPGNHFDSSLLGPGDTPRKAYYVLRSHYAANFQ